MDPWTHGRTAVQAHDDERHLRRHDAHPHDDEPPLHRQDRDRGRRPCRCATLQRPRHRRPGRARAPGVRGGRAALPAPAAVQGLPEERGRDGASVPRRSVVCRRRHHRAPRRPGRRDRPRRPHAAAALGHRAGLRVARARHRHARAPVAAASRRARQRGRAAHRGRRVAPAHAARRDAAPDRARRRLHRAGDRGHGACAGQGSDGARVGAAAADAIGVARTVGARAADAPRERHRRAAGGGGERLRGRRPAPRRAASRRPARADRVDGAGHRRGARAHLGQ